MSGSEPAAGWATAPPTITSGRRFRGEVIGGALLVGGSGACILLSSVTARVMRERSAGARATRTRRE